MSTISETISAVNPVAAPYAAHLVKLAAIEAAEDDVRREAREAVLGPVEGRCCRPDEGETPCLACDPFDLVPDDEPFIPSAADEADYRDWCRERDARSWASRWATELSAPLPEPMALAEWLDAQAAQHRRIGGDKREWLASKLASLAEQARWLDATTPDIFEDRMDARLDSVLAAHGGR